MNVPIPFFTAKEQTILVEGWSTGSPEIQPSILALLWLLLQKLTYTGHEIRTILKSSTFSLLPVVLMSHTPRPPPQICSDLLQKRTHRHLRGSVRLQLHVCPYSIVMAKEQTILLEGWSTGSPRKR